MTNEGAKIFLIVFCVTVAGALIHIIVSSFNKKKKVNGADKRKI
jgi:hypothetical protein